VNGAGTGPAPRPAYDRGMTVEPVLPAVVRRRLATVSPDPTSWLATAFVAMLAGVLRFAGLRYPPSQIFDEVYYANEAQDLIKYSVEWHPDTNAPEYVVHPPLGKWLIALGELMFGHNSLGWRFSAAVVGTLSIVLIVRIGRRLFRSTVLGCAAGLLVSLDGMHFVLSRSALLDIFLMLFVVAAFGCVLLDRDWRRARWLAEIAAGRGGQPRLGVPWWRLAAAVMLGCACAVKLSGAFFVPALILLMLMWEVGLRRAVGSRAPWRYASANVLGWSVAVGVVALSVYVASWTGWFLTDTGWNRHGLAARGQSEPPVLGALANLWQYHKDVYTFHHGLNKPHEYQSWPWQWLLMGRPVAFYRVYNQPCGADKCVAHVLLLGNPLLWWSFVPALAGAAWFGIGRRDRRAAAIGIMLAAALLPWFWYHYDGGRTMYVFYALPALPFLVFAVVYVLGMLMGPATDDRRLVGAVIAGAYILLIAACFAYFHPLYVGESIPFDDWWDRMLLGRRWA
jgi:dolichyl-phosphate-mannose-protein mannosyltransferase